MINDMYSNSEKIKGNLTKRCPVYREKLKLFNFIGDDTHLIGIGATRSGKSRTLLLRVDQLKIYISLITVIVIYFNWGCICMVYSTLSKLGAFRQRCERV